MAVAYAASPQSHTVTGNQDILSYTWSYTNNGNAIALLGGSIDNTNYAPPAVSATYNGVSLTQDFLVGAESYNSVAWTGLHLLNAPSGAHDLVISVPYVVDTLWHYVISVSGASTTASVLSNKIATPYFNNADINYTTPNLAIPSRVNDLVIAMAGLNTGYSYFTAISGTNITPTAFNAGFWGSYTAGASPSVNINATFFYDWNNGESYMDYALFGWSFAPSGAGPTPHAYIGYSGVVNQIQTTPGNASGVVGNANNGSGDDVAGSGVVDVYTGVP